MTNVTRRPNPRPTARDRSGREPRPTDQREPRDRRDGVRSLSRRERPAKAALSREAILDAAMAIVDAEGVDALTMRRLAEAVDTGPASLYVYFANRDDLLGAVVDRAYADVALPDPSAGTWRERATNVMIDSLWAVLRHRGLASVSLGAIPSGEHQLRMTNYLVGCFREGGMSDIQVAWAIDMLGLLLVASAAERDLVAGRIETTDDPDAVRAFFQQVLRANVFAKYPDTLIMPYYLARGDMDDRTRWFLQVVLNGIQHTPPPEPVGENPFADLFEELGIPPPRT